MIRIFCNPRLLGNWIDAEDSWICAYCRNLPILESVVSAKDADVIVRASRGSYALSVPYLI